MLDAIEKALSRWFPMLDNSDIRHIAKILYRALVKKGQSIWRERE